MSTVIQIHPRDTVAVALVALASGQTVTVNEKSILLSEDIPPGHKFAVLPMNSGDPVTKYGYPIGRATQSIIPGNWVHTHNLATSLGETAEYRYTPVAANLVPAEPERFLGYRRPDGRVGVRNEVWIIPTVGCVNDVADRLARECSHLATEYGIDGIYAYPHPYGCSQMGDDHTTTQRLLAALVRHPNAGGVLVLGLGCENNTMESFREVLGEWDDDRVKFLVCQEEADEIAAGHKLLRQLAVYTGSFRREELPVSQLVVGMKCGGSDGFSGVTANPVVGAFSDLLIAQNGSAILTEVPEMFGAEEVLMNRASSSQIFHQTVSMVEDFKDYFTSHGQVVYENPSPGNKQGGISTLEDKSLGCVQKGGSAPVVDVIGYAESVRKQGLTLLSGPGNDLVSATALAAAGAQIILFTTGRGTPFGAPVPTLKLSSNTALAQKKSNWIDFDTGTVADGEPMDTAARRLLKQVIATASGQQTCTEKNGYRGISIFKDGVIL